MCAKSQVSKWNKCKLHEQLRVQLCSCRVETVLFQFKYRYGREQRHQCGTLSLKNYQFVQYYHSKWLFSVFLSLKYMLVGAAHGLTSRLMCCSVPGACLLYNLIYVPESFCLLGNTNVSG